MLRLYVGSKAFCSQIACTRLVNFVVGKSVYRFFLVILYFFETFSCSHLQASLLTLKSLRYSKKVHNYAFVKLFHHV